MEIKYACAEIVVHRIVCSLLCHDGPLGLLCYMAHNVAYTSNERTIGLMKIVQVAVAVKAVALVQWRLYNKVLGTGKYCWLYRGILLYQ